MEQKSPVFVPPGAPGSGLQLRSWIFQQEKDRDTSKSTSDWFQTKLNAGFGVT